MTAKGTNLGTSAGIVGTGIALLAGAVVVGGLICGGGFGGAVFERLPEIVFAEEPVVIPATSQRLPDLSVRNPDSPSPASVPVARNPEPRSPFRDPARWMKPSQPAPSQPVPVQPAVPVPVAPVAVPMEPVPPVEPVAPVPTGPSAQVTVSGDALGVVAVAADGRRIALPGALPTGKYDVVVTFAGRDPFSVTSLLVLDTRPRSVTCRSALGLCKVR